MFVARHAPWSTAALALLVIALAAGAFVVVWRFRVGVVATVLVCAAAGLGAAPFR